MEGVELSDFSEFFNGKKVLVTGHTGFKGSWLCMMLDIFGAKIFGYALEPNTEPDLYSALKLRKKLSKEKIADIGNYGEVRKFFEETKPEIVIHLAAQPLVRDSYDDPLYTYETNVIGTANVLQAVKEVGGVEAAVIITTDKVYEDKEKDGGYKENDELGGHEPYSASKVCAEFVTKSYIRSFFNLEKNPNAPRVATARAGNVIGGGDWSKDRLVPDIIKAKQKGKKLRLRNPDAIRPWQHVLEPNFGYLLLAKALYEKKKNISATYNFASEEKNFVTVKEIAQKSGAEFEILPDEKKHEAKMLKLDASKAKEELGWAPKIGIEKALEMTFEWYDKYYSKNADMAEFTQGQINNYFEK
ncbi:MAG: CDP-glucose 4,6-dehydratase [Candidatus Micrarchaeota archaeon]